MLQNIQLHPCKLNRVWGHVDISCQKHDSIACHGLINQLKLEVILLATSYLAITLSWLITHVDICPTGLPQLTSKNFTADYYVINRRAPSASQILKYWQLQSTLTRYDARSWYRHGRVDSRRIDRNIVHYIISLLKILSREARAWL
jgi:hypothetical protein